MLKTALTTVLRRYWLLATSIVTANIGFQYWRNHDVSVPLALLTLIVVALALLVVALPVEFHKLRKPR